MSSMQDNRINEQIFTNSDSVVTERFRITSSNKFRNSRVLVIGLGQLGLPIAKYVRERI